MQVLLDESVPRGLRKLLPGHQVRTVVEQGWKSVRNSLLLSNAQSRFDVLVTADRGFEHEQNLALYEIGIIVLVASSNRLADYEPLVPSLLAEIETVKNGELRKVAADPGAPS